MSNSSLNNILKCFCKGLAPVASKVEQLPYAIKIGLGPIIREYSTQKYNSDVEEMLASDQLITKFWKEAQLSATKNIIKELNINGITPTLLKGISISTSFYPKSYYRKMNDIDLLVKEKEIDQVESLLPSLGYKQHSLEYTEEFFNTIHHTMPWQHETDEVWIELHKKLFPKTSPCYKSKIFQLETIENEKRCGELFGFKVYHLSNEFQIVYIASHWAERFKQVGSMFALIDVALIINQRNSQLDWNKIIDWSNTTYVSNYTFLLLQYISKNGLLSDNREVELALPQINHSLDFISLRVLNRFICKYYIEGEDFGRILNLNIVTLVWEHLLESRYKYLKVITIPLAVAFPKGRKKRFSLQYQWSRIQSLLRYRA